MLIPETQSAGALTLINNFKPTEQLRVRIQKLIKDTGIKHKTIQDIPLLLPSERQKAYQQ